MRREDIKWGAGWGLFGGVLYMVMAAAVLVLELGNAGGIPVPLLLAFYPLAGVFAGGLVGVFRNRLARKRAAQTIGGLISIPLALTVFLMDEGVSFIRQPADVLAGVAIGFGLGWLLAGLWWEPPAGETDRGG